MNQITDILESDVEEANDKMLGKETDNSKNDPSDAIIFILFVLLVAGVISYFRDEKDKEKGKLKIKDDDGNIKEIDLTVSESEIENALEKLKNS